MTSIQRRAAAFGIVLVSLTACGTEASSPPGAARQVVPAVDVSQAKAWALSLAAQAGDRQPKMLLAVPTLRAEAGKLVNPGTTIDSNEPVITVVLSGSFDQNLIMTRPAWAEPLPTRDTLVVSFNAATGEITDMTGWDSSRQGTPDLKTLGVPVQLN